MLFSTEKLIKLLKSEEKLFEVSGRWRQRLQQRLLSQELPFSSRSFLSWPFIISHSQNRSDNSKLTSFASSFLHRISPKNPTNIHISWFWELNQTQDSIFCFLGFTSGNWSVNLIFKKSNWVFDFLGFRQLTQTAQICLVTLVDFECLRS